MSAGLGTSALTPHADGNLDPGGFGRLLEFGTRNAIRRKT